MIGLRIGAAELAEIEAGAPAVVLAPGATLPSGTGLLPLELDEGTLRRAGAEPGPTAAVPPGLGLLALFAPDPAAGARLAPLLPAGLPWLRTSSELIGLLSAALRDAMTARLATEAERDRLRRALAALPPPRSRQVLDLPPGPAEPLALPLIQPLGRAAEGLCSVALHLAEAGEAMLRVRLLAGARVLGSWRIPPASLAPGWLELDLPEPAPNGAEEAVLELAADPGPGAPARLSAAADGAGPALRAWDAARGWSVLPQHFDWAATGMPRLAPGIPLPLPAALLAGAEAEGTALELVGAGEEPPRLLLELPPGATATLRLPPLAPGPADLLRLTLAQRGGQQGGLSAEVTLEGHGAEPVCSGWREMPAGGELRIALPLPAVPMVAARLALRQAGPVPLRLELASVALMSGVAGEPRRPPAEMLAAGTPGGPRRMAVAVPGDGGAAAPMRAGPPAPRFAVAGPGGVPAELAPSPAAGHAGGVGMPGGTSYQEFRLIQHLANKDGSYRHLDLGVSGLVSGGGLWRQLRLKLFERRGVVGLEFRDMKGWPPMFDIWPGGRTDNYGPFWRLETVATARDLASLVTPHDRALIAAVLEVLPELAGRAAGGAKLTPEEVAAWTGDASRLADAVAEARGIVRGPG
jgi:hypothetical protein